MAVFQDALQYALTLLRQGRLRLDELCSVMALYGARTLRGEERADPSTPAVELIDELVAEVLQGSHTSQLMVASDLMSLWDIELQRALSSSVGAPGSMPGRLPGQVRMPG